MNPHENRADDEQQPEQNPEKPSDTELLDIGERLPERCELFSIRAEQCGRGFIHHRKERRRDHDRQCCGEERSRHVDEGCSPHAGELSRQHCPEQREQQEHQNE